MKILEAGENYLETILIEQKKIERIRSIDVCRALGYSKPTVSVAMKQLRENGFINMEPDGTITLTRSGREIAERMYERHNILAAILMDAGVSEQTAYADACKIEHDISEESFECLKKRFYENQEKE